MDMYNFTAKTKRLLFALMGIGVIALLWGVMAIMGAEGEEAHHHAVQRLWSNILINGFFFLAISCGAMFFLAMNYAAETGWSMVLKRVMEAVASFMPIGLGVLLLVLLAGQFHQHHLYHWMAEGINDPEHAAYDPIIAHKEPYFGWFFWLRFFLFATVWVYFQQKFRTRSIEEDMAGGIAIHKKNFTAAAIFLVFFGYTSSVAAWDWIMSIDTHWFSTLFGWYVFSGMWVGGLIVMTLLTLHLKSRGHLEEVNKSHIQDLGKWMFAISFLWTYLWFSQFMLIWYSNIPEEVMYYQARIEDYTFIYFGMMIVNFALPMLVLMDRDAKRKTGILVTVGIFIFIGHWLDTYMLITPGTMKDHGQMGFLEIGMFLGFLGLFVFRVLSTVSKASVSIKQNPYLEESKHFHQ